MHSAEHEPVITANQGRDSTPGALWVFLLGFALYSVVPVIPGTAFIPVNPAALFAVVMALLLMVSPARKLYWGLMAVNCLAIVAPVIQLSGWLKLSEPSLVEVLFALGTPALLLCLLRQRQVRAFAGLEVSESGSELDPEGQRGD